MKPERADQLILVAGHAAFRQGVRRAPRNPEDDAPWVLEPFQAGQPQFFIEHMRRGVVLAAHTSTALLMFSGGRTRMDVGSWSEARTYRAVGERMGWWLGADHDLLRRDIEQRVVLEGYARDSFENLLFGLCRFRQITGSFPKRLTVISWAFKHDRFVRHRESIRFPKARFRYEGFNEPFDIGSARRNERRVLRLLTRYPYGARGEIAKKREDRNPYGDRHPYTEDSGIKSFFEFIAAPVNATRTYPDHFPWEPSR